MQKNSVYKHIFTFNQAQLQITYTELKSNAKRGEFAGGFNMICDDQKRHKFLKIRFDNSQNM